MATQPTQRLQQIKSTMLWLCALGCIPAWAQEVPVMRWLVMHLPPASLLVDGQPSNGTADLRLKLIIAQWPEVKHAYINAKPSRIFRDLADPDSQACANIVVVTPEREKQMYLTATSLYPPVVLIAKPEVLRTMARNARGEVLPGALFDRTDLTGIVHPGRSYTAVIDSMLARRGPKTKIDTVIPWHGGANILEMIALGRGDYTLEFERTFNYLNATEPRTNTASLDTAPIAGGVINQVAIACPRNAWGYAAIKKIDAIVTALATNPEFQRPTNYWVAAKEPAYLKAATDKFYKARALPTPANRYTPP